MGHNVVFAPGFITSLYHLWRQNVTFSTQEIEDGLAGNLCRCTGYGPIVAAAKSLRGDDIVAPAWAGYYRAEDASLMPLLPSKKHLRFVLKIKVFRANNPIRAAKLYHDHRGAQIYRVAQILVCG